MKKDSDLSGSRNYQPHQKTRNLTLLVHIGKHERFIKQLKTPAQLWYYCTVYPEDVTICHAEVMYRERETSYQDDGYYESVFRLIYDIKWEDSELHKTTDKIMEGYYREQETRNKTISRESRG